MITLTHYLLLAAALFCIGLFGVIAKKNAISVMMGIELMLNAANINLVAFNHFIKPDVLTGHIFAIFVIIVAASEVTVGLAVILSLYRHHKAASVDDANLLKW